MEITASHSLTYRREVDGLRAIAVLSVILFHAGYSWCPGGFVGVDVFFVISGYLITSIIISELNAGTFTIAGFYERRARRILPALFFVLLCTLPSAYLWLFPDQMTRFAKSLLSGLFFITNFYFAINMGYFAPNAENEPLLHLWSLAVEEQYYIFFPVLAMLLWNKKQWFLMIATIIWRHRSWGFVFVITAIMLLSFYFAEKHIGEDALFYNTKGRIWELLIGSLVAIYMNKRQCMPKLIWAEIASILGLFLILTAVFGLNKKMPFPGHYALLPTIGAALLILFSSPATLTGRLLSTQPMVAVGLISYSAYLWHWPVFVFTRIIVPAPSQALFLVLSVFSLLLAWISWRFVERPFRNRQRIQRRKIFCFTAIGVVFFTIIASICLNGLSFRFDKNDADFIVSHEERTQYVVTRYNNLLNKDSFSNTDKIHVLLVGDSHSQDFFNIAMESGLLSDSEIMVRYVSAKCQIYLGKENGLDFVEEADRPLCANLIYGNKNFYTSLQQLVQKADVVIFVASWKEWAARRLPETIENLHIPNTTRVIVIAGKSFGAIRPRDYLELSKENKIAMRNKVYIQFFKINEVLRANFENNSDVEFVDLYELICDKATQTCPLFTPDGHLLSHDGGHLTQAGATYIGGLLRQHPAFKSLRSDDGRDGDQ